MQTFKSFKITERRHHSHNGTGLPEAMSNPPGSLVQRGKKSAYVSINLNLEGLCTKIRVQLQVFGCSWKFSLRLSHSGQLVLVPMPGNWSAGLHYPPHETAFDLSPRSGEEEAKSCRGLLGVFFTLKMVSTKINFYARKNAADKKDMYACLL